MIGADGPSQDLTVPDWPPHKGDFWQKARIDGDKVFDPETERGRTLLVLRWSVQQIWPEQLSTPPPEEARPQGGAPSYRDKIEKRLVGFDLTNIADATRHVRDTWPDNDGPCPTNKTIRKWVKQLRTERKIP